MGDMSEVIKPKVDQLTADDLLAGPVTIRIREVKVSPGTEQPVNVYYDGDNGKPWRPCKSTARLMVAAWGPDSKEYVGKSLTLYRDDKVKWGGLEVGGVRVSHMSHIDSDLVLALTMTKGKKAPTRVKPLKAEVAAIRPVAKAEPVADASGRPFDFDRFEAEVMGQVQVSSDATALKAWWEDEKPDRVRARDTDKARAGKIATAVNDKIAALEAGEGEVF